MDSLSVKISKSMDDHQQKTEKRRVSTLSVIVCFCPLFYSLNLKASLSKLVMKHLLLESGRAPVLKTNHVEKKLVRTTYLLKCKSLLRRDSLSALISLLLPLISLLYLVRFIQ